MSTLITIPKTTIVTVNVTYFRPDYKHILNVFLWQTLDDIPDLHRVHRFLNYWKEHIEAVIHTIEVAIPDKAGRPSWRNIDWVGHA